MLPFRPALQQFKSPPHKGQKSQNVSGNCSCVGTGVADGQSSVNRTRTSAKDSSHFSTQVHAERNNIQCRPDERQFYSTLVEHGQPLKSYT